MKNRAKFVLQYAHYTLKPLLKRLNTFYINLENNRKIYIEKSHDHLISWEKKGALTGSNRVFIFSFLLSF